MRTRRAVTMIIVLVVVIVAALVGVGALDTGRSIAGVARTGADHDLARSIAMAGVRGVAEDLLDQRDAMLEGEDPSLEDEVELWSDGDRRAVAILLPVGPEGETLVSESAKLDLNRATAEMLAELPGVGMGLAQAIVGARPDAGYQSVDALLDVDGVTPTLLFGDRDRWARAWSDADTPVRGGESALIDHVTVYAAEPNVQRGLGEVNADFAGQLRVNLNRTWSDDIERELADLFDDDIVSTIRTLNQRGAFADEPTFLRTLDNVGLGADDIRWILDLFTTTADPYLIGRVDTLRAPAPVLGCLPGITSEVAEGLVALRETLTPEARASAMWLVSEGGLSQSQFVELAPWTSARSMQWRVRIRTGIVVDDAEEFDPQRSTRLEHERVTEVVVDLAAPRPRLALLEDITQRPLVASLLTPEDREERAPGVLDLTEDAAIDDEQDTDPRAFTLSGRPRSDRGRLDRSPARERVAARSGESGSSDAPDSPSAPPEGVDRRVGRWTSGAPRGQMPTEQSPEAEPGS
ncbi:MAG: hypothetical protein Tsb0013_08640 [Phycisphaerales bacterium]